MTQENKADPFNKNPREIEAAIGDTRNALTDDIKALSDKASPAHIKQEAKQAIKNVKDNVVDKAVEKSVAAKDVVIDKAQEIAEVAVEKASEVKELAVTKAHEAADAIAETAEEVATQTRDVGRVAWQFTVENAVPLSLIGLGAGLLLTNQRKAQRERLLTDDWAEEDYAEYPEDYPADNLAFAADGDNPARRVPALAARPKRKAPTALNKAGRSLRETSKSAYNKAGQSLDEAEHKLLDTAARGRDAVTDRLRSVQRASREFAEANPLALAFGTLLAGVGVGLLLPSSSREDALLRPARTRIRGALGDARRAAEDVSDVAKRTVRETVATATGELNPR